MTLDTNIPPEKLLTTIQQEYKILAEYKMIQSEDVGGVYVIPSHENSFLWFGVIFVRDGYYKDGVFRFNMSLPDQFPEDKNPPTVIFQSEVFHPLVCPYTGTLNISEAFPVWKAGSSHIWQLLKFIQFVLVHPEECLSQEKFSNPIAAELLSQNKADFLSKVKNCVELSIERVFETSPTEDKHYITFEKFEAEIHGPVLENLKNNKDTSSPQCSGLSWVKEGEFKPLSRE